MNTLTDNQLMIQVRDGDVDKLGMLFERYHKKLYNFFLRIAGNRNVSEDLVQEVFFRMLKYRETYQGQSKFTTWMFKIAHNANIDYFRKHKREEPIAENYKEPVSPDPVPEDQIEQSQEIAFIRYALAKLSLKKREVLVLSRFHNLKYDEIAELLGCRTGTVKVHVHRAIKDLEKIYTELSGGLAS